MSKAINSSDLLSVLDVPVFIDAAEIELLYDSIIRTAEDASLIREGRTEWQEIVDDINVIEEVDKYPQKKLQQILYLYYNCSPDSIVKFQNEPDTDLFNKINSDNWPPQLIFLDLPGKNDKGQFRETIFIPTAAEFDSNHIEVLAQQFKREDDDGSSWRAIGDHLDVNYAIAVLEEQFQKEGPIQWIDFRLPVVSRENNTIDEFREDPSVQGDQSIHFHFSPEGQYDVSTFAYNLLKQGWKNGVTMIGALNRGPDVQVLSYYSK